jgi:tetratricopeptide (TPR) repeat protein
MNNEKTKTQNGVKTQNGKQSPKPGKSAVATAPQPAPAAAPQPVKVPPLFRRVDWIALIIAFVGVWAVYLWTLAPELTLEDSGELVTGAFYAGIPHPPGYPFWSIYSWFWTAILGLLHMGNAAWRVEVGESFAAAFGCGLLALMVSRGSSMFIESIEELKTIARRWENSICLVSGSVAGLLLGLGAFMWSESDVINRISLFGVPWLLVVVALLFRWAYAPHQRRYLYLSMLCYGWVATIHQTLLLSLPGLEILVALVLPKLGRDLFVWNTVGYVLILLLKAADTVPAFSQMTSIEIAIFHFVGIGSFAGWTGMYLSTLIKQKHIKGEWMLAFWVGLLAFVGVFILLYGFLFVFRPASVPDKSLWNSIPYDILNAARFVYTMALFVFGAVCVWKGVETRQFGRELLTGILLGLVWFVGVSVYLYEPISCMTDPPMQWGYPRTVEGFFHALGRGQYGSDNGTDLFQSPKLFLFQLFYLADGLSETYTWAYLFVGLIPFFFIFKMQRRERNWILGLAAIYFFISVMLVLMLNVSEDRSTVELNKVFFTASHAIFGMLIGYGVTILAAYIATHYERIRRWCFVGVGVFFVLAMYCLVEAIGKLYFGPGGQMRVAWLPDWYFLSFLAFGPGGHFGITEIPHWIAQAFTRDQYGLPIYANLILVSLPLIFLGALLLYRKRGPVTILLALFCITPLTSGLSHWYHSEQRNHWFGYWFGHDMFTPPYMDKGQLSYDNDRRAELLKDPEQAKWIYPEMTRNAILFGGTDPGRFCPTYIIFCESFIPHFCQPKQDQKFDRRDVYIITQNALADGTYLDYLRAQYFRSHQHDPAFFSKLSEYLFGIMIHSTRKAFGENYDKNRNLTPQQMQEAGLTPDEVQRENAREDDHDQDVADSGLFHTVNWALYNVLDRPSLWWGKRVETRRRAEGVYPPNEIYIPSPDDSQTCFNNYYSDVQRRMQLNQLQPGEEVSVSPDGRMQVSGQVAVMMINGLLCKVIFDNNPTNEFFVEESFPLPWMYPYETPFGVIMKINRQPLPQLTQEIFDRDHKFWKDYSQRLCGDFIDYNTSVGDICDFVQRTYVQNNYKDFKGNPAFVRDEDGQKAFSKLRSSQAGMYAWRCALAAESPFHQQTPQLQDALVRETDFAFKQAFAFCPYSPEAVFRYVQFLMQYNRVDDALLIAKTCLKLDPYNESVSNLINQLQDFKKTAGQRAQMMGEMTAMQERARTTPTDYTNLFSLAGLYLQMQQTNNADALFDQAISHPKISMDVIREVAGFYAQTGQYYELEKTLKRLTEIEPNVPEGWYDFSRLEVMLGRKDEGIKALATSIQLSDQRLKTDPHAMDIRAKARDEAQFNPIRNSPEFQKLVSP